jgi:hypothetical protein
MSYRMPIVFMILLLALIGWSVADSVAETDTANIKAFNQHTMRLTNPPT